MIITLTSAGYGDLYPKTFFGRIVGVIICFWGVLVTSFFVVSVTNTFEFTKQEQKAYDLLMRLYFKNDLKIKATRVVSEAFILRNVKRSDPKNKDLILS